MTDAARHEELKRLFLGAADLDSGERADWLARECADPSIRAEVDRLLGVTIRIETRSLLPDPSEFAAALDDMARATAAEEEPVPAALGPYRIDEVLGRGGMGVVYGALDTRLERRVALKQVPAPRARPAAEDAFRQEMRTLAALHHPNIALLYALEEWDGRWVAAIERVPGETLAARIARGAVPPKEALRIVHQVCRALEAAHEEGIVHLDLKPANVMVTPGGQVKVLDFGIARSLGGEANGPDSTEFASVAGTPGHMAPELLRGEPVDARADLFALGVLLFESLAGRSPFRGDTIASTLAANLAGVPDTGGSATLPWDAIPGDALPEVRGLIARCLRPDPAARPESAAEIRRTIDGWIAASHLPDTEEAAATRISTLPSPWNRLIGRVDELAEIETSLRAGALVTLTGLGGSGKTRLALEVARRAEFAGRPERRASADRDADLFDEVHWVPLAPLAEDGDVVLHVATALDLAATPADLPRALADRLSAGRTLAVLDNCEHVIEPIARWVASNLPRLPSVTILATGRIPLGLGGELAVPIAPLRVPGSDDDAGAIRDSPAVQLFLERADLTDIEPDSAEARAVASICRRLDGIPLALELAASRLRVLSLDDLARRLDDRFSILTGGSRDALPHQRTLRATLDWSHDLLSEIARTLLRRLAVFADGWTLDAAERICADDALGTWEVLDALDELVSHSLVVVVDGASDRELRYRFLTSVRDYALERLRDDPAAPELERRLLGATTRFCEDVERKIEGPDQQRWLRRLDQEHPNITRAFEIAEGPGGDPLYAVRMATSLWHAWETQGRAAWGLERLRLVLPRVADRIDQKLLAHALNARASLAQHIGDHRPALEDFDRCIALCRRIAPDKLGVVLMNSAILIKSMGDHPEARRRYEEALRNAEEQDNDRHCMLCHLNIAVLDQQQGRIEPAREHQAAALALAERLGDTGAIASIETTRGNLNREVGDAARALQHHERAHEIYRTLGDRRGLALSLNNLSLCARDAGDDARALEIQLEALTVRREIGDRRGLAIALVNLVSTTVSLGELDRARSFVPELVGLLLDLGEPRVSAFCLENTGHLLEADGSAADAASLFAAATRLRGEVGMPLPRPDQPHQEEAISRIRESLGDGFEPAWERGRGWDRTTALEEARERAARGG